jgi:hypothetical protein
VIERLALQDDELVARTRAGKAGAFAALMQRYKAPVRRKFSIFAVSTLLAYW